MSRQRADLLLVERGVFESRAKARAAIEAGGVVISGRTVVKPSELFEDDAQIVAEPAHRWVGRGALKLDHALATWPIVVEGRVVIDVGASTGGFTQVCLERGAARVYAVDVGVGQLHPRVAADPRVVNLEAQDARRLDRTHVAQPVDLIVCDVSFISLAKVLPAILDLAAPGADLVCLIKPQFEAGPGRVGKGGIVRDDAVRAQVRDDVLAWLAASGWTIAGVQPSPITGADGNVEYLAWAKK